MKHDLNGKLVVVVVILGAKEELENCKVSGGRAVSDAERGHSLKTTCVKRISSVAWSYTKRTSTFLSESDRICGSLSRMNPNEYLVTGTRITNTSLSSWQAPGNYFCHALDSIFQLPRTHSRGAGEKKTQVKLATIKSTSGQPEV
jgi:hypothetical protein